MENNDFAPSAVVPLDECGLASAIALIGDKWTLLLLREAFYGVRRFEAFRDDIGIPRTVLSQRLSSLVSQGVMARDPYQKAGQRTRFEYRLTKKGSDLLPILIALMQWGDRHVRDSRQPSLQLHHAGCGAPVSAALVCSEGHVISKARDIEASGT